MIGVINSVLTKRPSSIAISATAFHVLEVLSTMSSHGRYCRYIGYIPIRKTTRPRIGTSGAQPQRCRRHERSWLWIIVEKTCRTLISALFPDAGLLALLWTPETLLFIQSSSPFTVPDFITLDFQHVRIAMWNRSSTISWACSYSRRQKFNQQKSRLAGFSRYRIFLHLSLGAKLVKWRGHRLRLILLSISTPSIAKGYWGPRSTHREKRDCLFTYSTLWTGSNGSRNIGFKTPYIRQKLTLFRIVSWPNTSQNPRDIFTNVRTNQFLRPY